MPEEFAKRLAKQLIEDHVTEPVYVELDDAVFAKRVAEHLKTLGCTVEFPGLPTLLRILPPDAGTDD